MPAGFLEQLLEYRVFAACKALVDRATTAAERQALPASPLIDLVHEIEFGLAAEEMEHDTTHG